MSESGDDVALPLSLTAGIVGLTLREVRLLSHNLQKKDNIKK